MTYDDKFPSTILNLCRDDAATWAREFAKLYPSIPEHDAYLWFHNAIEWSHEIRHGRAKERSYD